jgi:hypothetical protein
LIAAGFTGQLPFPATQVPSADPNTLDDYEEGTWTPTDASGASLVFTGPAGIYVKVGQQVTVVGTLTYPTTANASQAVIGGLPFIAHPAVSGPGATIAYIQATVPLPTMLSSSGSVSLNMYATGGAVVTNTTMSQRVLSFSMAYRTNT